MALAANKRSPSSKIQQLAERVIQREIGGVLDRSDELDALGGSDFVINKLAAELARELAKLNG